jgi:hypothetical protein
MPGLVPGIHVFLFAVRRMSRVGKLSAHPRESADERSVLRTVGYYFFSPPPLPTLAPPLALPPALPPTDGFPFPPPCIFAPLPEWKSAPPRPVVLRAPLLL